MKQDGSEERLQTSKLATPAYLIWILYIEVCVMLYNVASNSQSQ